MGCRDKNKSYPIDAVMDSNEAAALLATQEPGTMIVFDEAQYFHPALVGSWQTASERGVDVLVGTPSEHQLQLLANISHEIRTPLGAVLGMTELALEAATDARQQSLLNSVRSNAETLLALIGETLDVSRIEAGRIELGHAPYDLGNLVQELVGTFCLAAARSLHEGLSLRVARG